MRMRFTSLDKEPSSSSVEHSNHSHKTEAEKICLSRVVEIKFKRGVGLLFEKGRMRVYVQGLKEDQPPTVLYVRCIGNHARVTMTARGTFTKHQVAADTKSAPTLLPSYHTVLVQ